MSDQHDYSWWFTIPGRSQCHEDFCWWKSNNITILVLFACHSSHKTLKTESVKFHLPLQSPHTNQKYANSALPFDLLQPCSFIWGCFLEISVIGVNKSHQAALPAVAFDLNNFALAKRRWWLIVVGPLILPTLGRNWKWTLINAERALDLTMKAIYLL